MRKLYRILVDVDEVCLGLFAEWFRRYNLRSGDNFTPAKMRGWAVSEQVKPEWRERIFDILHEPDIYDGVTPLPGARLAVNMLRRAGHRVVFASSCAAGTVDGKVAAMQRWGFLPKQRAVPDFIGITDKFLLDGDFLVDDHLKNVALFDLAGNGRGVLVDQPHNRHEEWPGFRVRSLMDFAQTLISYPEKYGVT